MRYLRTGTGQPLLLLHTLRTQLEYFQPLVSKLGSGYDIVVPDLPGHGESDAPQVAYTAKYFTDSIEQLLEELNLSNVILLGESIGASIGLGLASRGNRRIARVIALNPYDYGRWGGARRSSLIGNLVFTTVLWPGIGPVVARAGIKPILVRIMAGGLYDPRNLPPDLVDDLDRCGRLPGHPGAFRSLCLNWKSWIEGRAGYGSIRTPVTLAYAEKDWSRAEDRDANAREIPGARRIDLENCGHFSCLERPDRVAQLIREEMK